MMRAYAYVGGLLALCVGSPGCRPGLPPGEAREQARTLPASQAADLFLRGRISSAERGQIAVILTARFGASSLPWLIAALSRYPASVWPDRFYVARALRALSSPEALALLLDCLGDPTDETLRAEAARALERSADQPDVEQALAAAAACDPSSLVRQAASAALGR